MTFTQHSYLSTILRTAEVFLEEGELLWRKNPEALEARKRECASIKLEIKDFSAQTNGRESTLARIQDVIFKQSGRKRENHDAMPGTRLLFGAQGDTQTILMAGI